MRWAQRRCFVRSLRRTCAGYTATATSARPIRTGDLRSSCRRARSTGTAPCGRSVRIAGGAVVYAAAQPGACSAADRRGLMAACRREVSNCSGRHCALCKKLMFSLHQPPSTLPGRISSFRHSALPSRRRRLRRRPPGLRAGAGRCDVAPAGRDYGVCYGAVDESTNSTVSYAPLGSTLTPGGGVPKSIRRPSPLSISLSSVP